ncbi:MAG: GAF domain-containing protein [Chloroflexi bacterium]|nr:GAF domain-containing protein [Chloroflexota bacterium]
MTEPIIHENSISAKISNRFQFLGNLTKPHNSVTDSAERQKVRFLATILLALAILTSINLPERLISGSAYEDSALFIVFIVFCTALFIEYGLCRTRHYKYAPVLAVITLTALIYSSFFLGGDYSNNSLLWLVAILVFASTILSLREMFIYTVGNILFIVLCTILIPDLSFSVVSTAVVLLFISTTFLLVQIQYRTILERIRQEQLTKANAELNILSQSLEKRVQDRTQDLALAGEVGRAISQIRDINALLTKAVTLIQEHFNLYYTQIYLADETQEKLILRAGTGEIGQSLLAQGHMLFIDGSSINGRVAARKEAVIVADTENSDIFHPNPLLPETRSEMAVPLIIQDNVVGVIDLQSNQANALSEDNLPTFTALAGQLAVAINNATLLTEMENTTTFLDSVIENLPVMLFVKEASDLRFVRWNKVGSELTGFSKEELVGKNDFDFFPEEEAIQLTNKDREILAGGKLVDIPEEPLHTAHQGMRLLHTIKVPIFDALGNPRYLMGISEDITERKQMERQLEERIRQSNFLNDMGRKANERLPLPQFLEWVAGRIPQAMSYPDSCVVAFTLGAEVYGQTEAMELSRHFIEELQARGERVGRIYVAYTDKNYTFGNAESALMGGISRRVSSYIELQYLLTQLQTQAEDLQKIVSISMAVATIHNPRQLLREVAGLIQSRFGLHQVTLFLLEENDLVLRAAPGEMGQQLISQRLRIPLSTQNSLVAQVAQNRQGIIVNDVTAEANFMAHLLLPGTRSELVTPLLIGDEVLGVLDVESDEADHFSRADLNVFTTLAAQIAVTLQNARQYEQTQTALEKVSSLQRVVTGEDWQAFFAAKKRPVQGYVANQEEVQIIEHAFENGDEERSSATLAEYISDEETFMTPIGIRGSQIGGVGVRPDAHKTLSDEDKALLAAISQQVAEALERARLFEETEIARQELNQRAEELAVINQVASTVSQQLEMNQLFTAVHEQIQRAIINDTFFVAIYNAAANHFDFPYYYDHGRQTDMEPLAANPEYETTQVFTNGEPIVINFAPEQYRKTQIEMDKILLDKGKLPTGMLFTPLQIGSQNIGVISVQNYQFHDYTESDIALLGGIANHVAVALENARLFMETERRAEQEQILRQVSEQVYSAVDAESVLKTAVKEVGRVLDLEAFVYLHDVDSVAKS